MKKSFWKVIQVFNSFAYFDRKKLAHPASFLRPGWRKCILRLYRYFLKRSLKKNFSLSILDYEHNFFCCKNCILRVPRNILAKVFFEENVYFFYQFCFLSEHFQLFVRILRTGLSKLKSTCRQEISEENWVFWKNCWCFCFFFSEMSEKFSTFDENFLAGLWKLLSTCE